jgi:hypothetical protein
MNPSNPTTPKRNTNSKFISPEKNARRKNKGSPFSPFRMLSQGDKPVFSLANTLMKVQPEEKINEWDDSPKRDHNIFWTQKKEVKFDESPKNIQISDADKGLSENERNEIM